MDKGTRCVVQEAHNFVLSYRDETGSIPAKALFGMGHMLAHCGMTNIMIFLNAYGFKNPGEFTRFVEAARKAGVTNV